MIRGLLVVVATLWLAPAEAAEQRLLDPDAAAPYRGVGRLNIAGSRFCTATLIEPTVIVTAAHCLYNPRTSARVPLTEFRFVAGLRRDAVAAVAQPVRAVVHPDFRYGDLSPARIAADLALMELAAPVAATDATPFAVGETAGADLWIVSYRRGRGQVATLEGPCPPVVVTAGTMTLACAVTYGISGAPVLAGTGEGARVTAVVSAMVRTLAGEDMAQTVLLAPSVDRLRAMLEEAED